MPKTSSAPAEARAEPAISEQRAGLTSKLLYAATIFLSAFLLFLVQPLMAKLILPWFGGSASVWLTRLVFFQVDVLVVDAFSSDAIPIHLLTRDAMALYFRQLKPDGILGSGTRPSR